MIHIPVLAAEVIKHFNPQPEDTLLDCTVGHGGHAKAYLEAARPGGRVIGLDADPQALARVAENLAGDRDKISLINANFAYLKDSLIGGGILNRGSTLTAGSSGNINHILYDLGIGSHQLADEDRGFSFQSPAPLKMRYGTEITLPASQISSLNWLATKLGRYPDAQDLVMKLSGEELGRIIRTLGEEKFAGRIGAAIKKRQPRTALELAGAVISAVPPNYEHGRIHPATRTFQAFRIAINRELEALTVSLPQAIDLLASGGQLGVISFHSLEDKIVKIIFRKYAKLSTKLLIITKKPIVPDRPEMDKNPRARSAKLRLIQRE